MSQAGIIDILGTIPELPTEFIADLGTAVPILNQLELLGDVVAAGSIPFRSVASGNTVTYQVQYSSGVASTDATAVGLAAFDSSMFNVDANGFVQLVGGAVGLDSLTGDDAVAVGADGAGNINLTGTVVANATNVKPLYFDGDAGTFTQSLELQVSTAIAGAPGDSNDAGICSFHSDQFDVDANGFVTLAGGSVAIDSNTGDDAVTVFPDANGNFGWIGTTVANATHTKPVYFKDSATPNSIDLDVQVSVDRNGAPANSNDAGLASFDDDYFLVDSNGYVTQTTLGIDTAMANFIVDPSGERAEYTTIAAALAAASAGDIIGIKEGTYTEDLTIDKNINFFGLDQGNRSSNSVILSGKLTFTGDHYVRIEGIQHRTNGDNLITDGGNTIRVDYFNCRLRTASAVVGLALTGTGGNIYLKYCYVEGFAGAQLFTDSGGYNIWCLYSWFETWDTASTATGASIIRYYHCQDPSPLSLSSTSILLMNHSKVGAAVSTFTNQTFLTLAGTGISAIDNSYISSGSSVAISIGSGTTLQIRNSTIQSTNATAAIDGAGTITFGGLTFSNNSTITTTTKNLFFVGPSISAGSSNSGAQNGITIRNQSNTASSDSMLYTEVGGSSAGDPFLRLGILGTRFYAFGPDNSDSDILKINTDTAGNSPSLGTNLWSMTTGGERTMPLQPCFLGVNDSNRASVTGAGTVYTVQYAAERFDNNGDFNTGTYTFTAPVTGKYFFEVSVIVASLSALMTQAELKLVTTIRSYMINTNNPSLIPAGTSGQLTINGSVIANMTAGDTAYVTMTILNGAGDTATVATNLSGTNFAGYLLC